MGFHVVDKDSLPLEGLSLNWKYFLVLLFLMIEAIVVFWIYRFYLRAASRIFFSHRDFNLISLFLSWLFYGWVPIIGLLFRC